MKKSIKYAGIAAATLLTVAPVAAPVVSNVTSTTVQAADASYTTSDDAAAWLNQFSSKKLATGADVPTLSTDNYGTSLSAKPADITTAYTTLLSNNVTDSNTFAAATDSKVTSVQATADDTGKALSLSDAQSYLNNRQALTFKIAVSYKTDADTTATKDASIDVTFATTDVATVTSLAAAYTTPYTVDYGSSTYRAQLQNSTDLTLKDQSGDNLLADSANVTSYAMGGLSTTYAKAVAGTADYDETTFDTADTTYYQPITVTVAADSALATYAAGTTYNTKTTVNGAVLSNGSDTTVNNGIVKDSTITFIRAVKVGSEAAAGWTTTKTTGVVTTKSDSSYYTLKNNDNVTIKNRALGANTSWQTNAVRTNANGDKQYRVATGEWVDADDVTFDDGTSTTTPSEDGLFDIQKVSGKVSLIDDGHVFPLYKKDGSAIKSRMLARGEWAFINTAKDSEGNTYYRVATNEWLAAGEGVTVTVY
ncbi:hypothetical protein M5C72_01880 [Companilactobacillus allii]|uniref:Surface layer protein A domain-containing protein n=1 Tax=Companilactobacillus allii TaxID=1847728 RepID=A0A1P8Q253_9LACO|nr:hypothetical protein [Companilactobacillus allii]APX71915.1 hypothetical protein BTM29_04800 [Companilactobacillus allii]USQ69007.1 hypothetical protein M5C72_01880 [Companilactobacillus allii]